MCAHSQDSRYATHIPETSDLQEALIYAHLDKKCHMNTADSECFETLASSAERKLSGRKHSLPGALNNRISGVLLGVNDEDNRKFQKKGVYILCKGLEQKSDISLRSDKWLGLVRERVFIVKSSKASKIMTPIDIK